MSLDTSFPLASGFVQKTPLALCPLIESGSPGICVNEIAPKFVTSSGLSKFLILITSL